MPWLSRPAAGLQQAGELGGVEVDLIGAHVLDHADRRDRVEALTAELAVVDDADLHAIGETCLGHTPARQLGLGWGGG